jgi:myo-inositol-1(or 4)-monophosphatase
MEITRDALETDWLQACRRATDGVREMLLATPDTASRVAETGTVGEGGDRTLVIDSRAEAIILDQLESLRARGYSFSVVSEELGEVSSDDSTGLGDANDAAVRVVIDPIDGSLNAKRGVSHHAVSIAVASGPTVAEVEFGYVYDFGPGEEWWAVRGGGAWLDGRLLDPSMPERRAPDGRLELLGIESADPRWVAASVEELVGFAYRLRAIGTIASTLCQVAAARFDAMATLRPCRAVDAAAGQLIVREAGGLVGFGLDGRLSAPLDVVPHAPLVAARSAETLRELELLVGRSAGERQRARADPERPAARDGVRR